VAKIIKMNDFEISGFLQPGCYSLNVGAPNPVYLKKVAEHIETGARELHTKFRFEESLQYGFANGAAEVRREIANFLTRQYEAPVEWEDIFITSGASSGLEILMKHYFNPEQKIFAENPTYPVFARRVNQDKIMTGVPIPIQSDGLDIEYFERELKKLPEQELTQRRPYRAAVYLVPTHHNPTGCCYSPAKCNQLIKLARQYDLLIICDDVYNALSYKVDEKRPKKFQPSPPRLYSYDRKSDPDYKGNVISNGSFAKIVAPGLRIGWYEAPKHVTDSLKTSYLINSGSCQSAYISYVLAEALKAGSIDVYVQSLRVAHKARMETVIEVIEENLAKFGVTISHPEGGYFLWVKLPPNIDSARVLELSSKDKVTFVKGNLTSICGDFSNYIRLCIAYYEPEDLKEGSQRLCRAIIETINEQNV